MSGFEKIDLNSVTDDYRASEPEAMKTRRSRSNKLPIYQRRWFQITGGVVAVLLLFLIFGIILPAKRVASSAKKVQADVKAVEYAFKTENIGLAGAQLGTLKNDLTTTQKDLHSMWYVGLIPVANFYYGDADHLINTGFAGIQAANTTVDALKPYADVLGLQGQGTYAGGSTQQRIQTAVLSLSKITPKLGDISASIDQARAELDKVSPGHYPAFLGGKKVQDQLTQARTTLDGASDFITQATPLIKVLPSLLGAPDPKKYLIIFQNDKELRPTGGFITADAIFKVDQGNLSAEPTRNIYDTDASISHPKAPAPILKYLPGVYEFNLRDSNLSPDFITSMDTFNQLYKQSADFQNVDGIIAIDTHVLTSILKVLGPVTVDGVTMTPDTDARCNCANVIYELEANISVPVNYIKADRKAMLSDLLYAIMQKALTSKPKQTLGPLFQTFITETAQKHILFDIYNQQAQSGIVALNAAGRIQSFDGDYLHINEANFGGQKSNLYVTEDVTQDYQVAGDGSVTKTITIHWKNPQPPSNCSLKAVDALCLNATLRDWIRVYVPKGSVLQNNSGSEVGVTTTEDLGKTVFEGFITVRPLGSKIYTLTYKLPFKIQGNTLPLMVQKQPGTDGNLYTITKGAKTLEPQFPLQTDQTFKLSL